MAVVDPKCVVLYSPHSRVLSCPLTGLFVQAVLMHFSRRVKILAVWRPISSPAATRTPEGSTDVNYCAQLSRNRPLYFLGTSQA
jgi:hypothetical protein